MDAGILAPIESIDGSRYTGHEILFSDKDIKSVFEKWHGNLQKADRFYADFSDRLRSGPKSLHRRIGKIISKRSEAISRLVRVINT